MDSFWSTLEVDCWSRSFDYTEYMRHWALRECKHTPLNHDTYDALCAILNTQMEDSFK